MSTLFLKSNIAFRSLSAMSTMKLKAALIQCLVGADRSKNLKNASALIDTAKSNGAQLVALPECFNSPYGTKFFNEYAETVPKGPTSEMLSEAAKRNAIYLIGRHCNNNKGPNNE